LLPFPIVKIVLTMERYIHRSPLTTIPPYTTLTPQQTMPCVVSDVAYPDYSKGPQAND